MSDDEEQILPDGLIQQLERELGVAVMLVRMDTGKRVTLPVRICIGYDAGKAQITRSFRSDTVVKDGETRNLPAVSGPFQPSLFGVPRVAALLSRASCECSLLNWEAFLTVRQSRFQTLCGLCQDVTWSHPGTGHTLFSYLI